MRLLQIASWVLFALVAVPSPPAASEPGPSESVVSERVVSERAVSGPAVSEPADSEPAAVVKKLSFEGVAAVSEAALRDAILTAGPTWKLWRPDPSFDEETLREDLDRIVGFYRERGYFEAQAEYDLTWEKGDSRVRIEIRVREGEPVRLVALSIAAADPAWLDDPARAGVLPDLPLSEGAIFGAVGYGAAKQELLRRLADLGHPAARLEGGADVELSSHEARLAWTIHPGPEVRFGPTRVVGLDDVAETLVRRELTYREGERFSIAALDASQKQIYGLGLFRSATLQDERPTSSHDPAAADDPTAADDPIAPDDPTSSHDPTAADDPTASDDPTAADGPDATEPAVWPISVRVEERPPRTVRVSVGYGTEDEFRGQVSWSHRNFFGGARVLDVIAKYSSLLAGGEVRFTQRRFFDPELSFESDVSFLRETVPAFDANRSSAGVLLTRPLFGHWRGRLGYRYELSDVTDLKVDELEGDESSRTSTLTFGLTRSSIDDPVAPRKGTWLDLELSPALEAIGSDSSFIKLAVEGRAYIPIFATVLAARVRAETVQPVAGSGIEDVPTVVRIFAGGSGSVRGFEFQHLPPLDDGDEPLGGLTHVGGSLELRFPIWRILHGVAFLDAGQLAEHPFTLDRFYFSMGPGIRITTPIGALGLDYGYLLNPPRGVDRGRIHFSVGASF